MYVPILKWKLGEKKALEQLRPDIIALITPLIELQPCEGLEEVVEIADKFGNELEKVWKSKQRFFLDVTNIEESCESEICYDLTHPLIRFIDKANSKGKLCIPIVPSRSMNDYAQLIKSTKMYFKEGIAIRVRKDSFLDADSAIPEFLNKINLPENKVSIIIDVQEVSGDDIPTLVMSIKSILGEIEVTKYQNIIMVGTGYPTDYPSQFMGAERYKAVQRTELGLWRTLRAKSTHAKAENVVFGDYCCSNSQPLPQDVSQMRPSAIIRYTREEAWHIWKGVSLMRGGHIQYHELAAELVASGLYQGASYSWGDEQILLVAEHKRNSGNPTTWVQIATNHHITHVAQQFSNLDAL